MEPTQQKSVVLILARELATNIATPMIIIDKLGRCVFFNEPAERLLGRSFAETGELEADGWSAIFTTVDSAGTEVDVTEAAIARVVTEMSPVHAGMNIRTNDAQTHKIEVTAYPLFARADEFVGAVAVFWEASQNGG